MLQIENDLELAQPTKLSKSFAGFAGSSPLVLEGKICAESAEQNDAQGRCGKVA